MHSSRMLRTTRLLTVSRSIVRRGVSGVCRGGSAQRGVCPACNGADTPRLLVNRIIDRCKNITLPQTWFAGGNKSQMYDVSELPCCMDSVLIIHLLFRDWYQLVWISKAQSMYGIGGEGRFLLQRGAIQIGSELFIEIKLL